VRATQSKEPAAKRPELTEETEELAHAPVRPAPVPMAGPIVVGAADDVAEARADELADRALRRLSTQEQHRHDPGCGHLRRASAPTATGAIGAAGGTLDPGTANLLASRRGQGKALPGDVRGSLESAFGTSLGHVRVHADTTAAGLNRAVSARAFTTGRDIFFGAGEYAPHTEEGRRVLAHELAHVITEPGPVVHRWWPFGKKKLSTEEQQRKDDEKAERKRARDAEKAEREERIRAKKAADDEAKQQRKEEKAATSADKKEAKGRAKLSTKVYQGPSPEAQISDLNAMFELAMASERSLVESLSAEHAGDETWSGERIADEAYRLTWLEGIYAEQLRDVRPPRGTSVERAAKARIQDREDGKQRAKESKRLEKAEKAELARSRKEGIAGRAALATEIAESGDASSAVVNLTRLFDEALAEERRTLGTLALQHAGDEEWPEERIADEAYRLVWLTGPYADRLKSVRPARETAAERLVYDVRHARTAAQVRADAKARSEQVGELLAPEIEKIYEAYVAHIDKAHDPQGNPPVDLATATAEAEALVWAVKPAKVRKKRPEVGSAVDREAVTQARIRLGLRPEPEVDTRSRLDRATGAVETGGGYLDQGAGYLEQGRSLSDKIHDAVTSESDPDKDPLKDTVESVAEKVPGVTFGKAVNEAVKRVNSGQRADPVPKTEDPTLYSQVSSGIGTVLSTLLGLKTTVLSAMKFAKAAKRAYDEPNPRSALAATKAGLDGVRSMTGNAAGLANVAKMITPAISDSVGKVVPGLNIASAVLGILSSAIDMADRAMRLHETNSTLFAARARDRRAAKVDVMVYPMLGLAERYSAQVEKTTWSTGMAVTSLMTSIATIASGGGYGIPAAVQAGAGLVDLLHSFGHFVADELRVKIAKTAKHESAVLHLEGGAERELRHQPGMAVDGIIMRAARGDEVALAFLGNYEVDGKPITAKTLQGLDVRDWSDPSQTAAADALITIREAVLADVGTEADPEHAYTKFKKQITGPLKAVTGRWKQVDELAERRNELDASKPGGGKKRGLGWRIKMMLKMPSSLKRSSARTGVQWRDSGLGDRPDPDAPEIRRVLVTCGDAMLPEEATDAEMAAFQAAVESMTTDEILAATNNPANTPEAVELLLGICQERWIEEASA